MARNGKKCVGANGKGCKFKGIAVRDGELCPQCIPIRRRFMVQERADAWITAHHAKMEDARGKPAEYSLAAEGAEVFGEKFQEA